jgi:uncharacterized SAM-binding protein YcdF (DUF218 family)
LLLVLTRSLWLAALGGYLVQAGPPVPADYVVVLAGDFTGNRILKAGELVREGFARQALVSGPSEMYGVHESDLAIQFAVQRGFPESYFVAVPNDAKSTVAEAGVMLAELRHRGAQRVDVVTSTFHTRRAGRIYRSQAGGLDIRMVAAPDRYFQPDAWWKSREGQKVFLYEWMKTVGSWFGL